MKYILEFNQYKKLNEGGGAGKNFEFENIEYDLKFEYSKDGIKLISKEVTLGDKMDLIGYEDGRRNIPTEGCFETDIEYTFSEEKLGNVTIGQIIYFTGDDMWLTNELHVSDYDKETTLKEIVQKGDTINIQITGNGPVEHMYGAGWLMSSMNKDTKIKIDITDIKGEWSMMDYIDDKNVQGLMFPYWYYAKNFESPDFTAEIVLKATEKFEEVWEEIFHSDDLDDDDSDGFDDDSQ